MKSNAMKFNNIQYPYIGWFGLKWSRHDSISPALQSIMIDEKPYQYHLGKNNKGMILSTFKNQITTGLTEQKQKESRQREEKVFKIPR